VSKKLEEWGGHLFVFDQASDGASRRSLPLSLGGSLMGLIVGVDRKLEAVRLNSAF
jgi:hypothetical protein